jgi:nucleoside-diphosphate-sugar epimerase
LQELENQAEAQAQVHFEINQQEASGLTGEVVLVTGGAGFLGKTVTQYLKNHGHCVRATSRRAVPYSARVPGVEYIKVDLSQDDLKEALEGVSAVIHCAAETAGGKEDHVRNSIEATKRIYEAAQKGGVPRFIHISSLGILKPGQLFGKPLKETSPVEIDNLGRGPYVWGKAESERLLTELSDNFALKPKIIRPGPLVDFINFEAPGRLGREMGPFYLVMGSKKSSISICDVWTVAKILHYYLDHYESAPPVLNVVEPQSTTRKDIAIKILQDRSDIKFIYVPTTIVKVASACAKILQKIMFPSRKPIDVAAAFSSEKYDTTLVRNIMKQIVSD